jgi:lipid A disaccharide synthetase
MDKLTVRGLFEVIPRYREIKGIQEALRDKLLADRPDAFVGVDYPGFNLGLEEQLKKAGIPTIHFIGPQIWAWRGWRIKKIQRAVSHMLVIFPFEESIPQGWRAGDLCRPSAGRGDSAATGYRRCPPAPGPDGPGGWWPSCRAAA